MVVTESGMTTEVSPEFKNALLLMLVTLAPIVTGYLRYRVEVKV